VDTGRNNLLEALKQVERRTENGASGWRLLFYAILLIPLALAVLSLLLKTYDVPEFRPPVVAVAAYLAIFALVVIYALHYSRRVRAATKHALNESDIAIKVSSGELIENDPLERVPWPWSLTIPGLKVKGLTQVIQRVAWNLDWYLKPPRVYWRWIWLFKAPLLLYLGSLFFLVLIMLALPIINLRNLTASPDYLESIAQMVDMIGATSLIDSWAYFFLLPLCFLHFRRQIWTEELVRHLRERLEA
jgi:hypothetical protein